MRKAIFGVFDSSPESKVSDIILKKMATPLSQFGNFNSLFCCDSIGLGAKQTYHGKPHSVEHITLTAYARLDNKEDLLKQIKPTQKTLSKNIHTEEIIALAYLKWGRHCTVHLLGDFVFALWDSKNKIFFCARDHMGVKPFYYSLANHCFTFSSTLDSLLALEYIPKTINEERVADYLTSVCLDNTTTFYTNISRLPPAHSITVSKNAFKIERYWEYTFPAEPPCSTDEEYAQTFKEIFFNAVACRVNSSKMAITMSGGLDSTSIACVADHLLNSSSHPQPITIYSAVYDANTECDEREYIQETLKGRKFSWNPIVADKLDPLASLFEIAATQHEPWFAPHMFMGWHLLKSMQSSGINLLLDGHDGDTVVSYGYGYFNELINNFNILTLLKETLLSREVLTSTGQKQILNLLYLKKIKPGIKKIIPSSIIPILKKKPVASHTKNISTTSFFFNESFRKQPKIKERINLAEKSKKTYRQERTSHYNHVFHPIQPFALEVLERKASAFSMEYRCPFWDKRLVEFCLSLPARQKFHNGWPRSILRRAMNKIIPTKIQRRKSKTDFTANLIGITDMIYKDSHSDLFLQCRQDLEKWIDFDKLVSHYKAHPEKKNLAMFDIWKILTLHAWLRTREH